MAKKPKKKKGTPLSEELNIDWEFVAQLKALAKKVAPNGMGEFDDIIKREQMLEEQLASHLQEEMEGVITPTLGEWEGLTIFSTQFAKTLPKRKFFSIKNLAKAFVLASAILFTTSDSAAAPKTYNHEFTP